VKLSLKLKTVKKQRTRNAGKANVRYLQPKESTSGFGVSWREAVVMRMC